MSPFPPFHLSSDLEERYRSARNVQDRFVFYYDYFCAFIPGGFCTVALPDLSRGQRKDLWLQTYDGDHYVMTGLVHRPSDKDVEEVAGDESMTIFQNYEDRTTFRFFTASETISFFKGDADHGYWDHEATFHPIHDAQQILDYLAQALVDDGLKEWTDLLS